MDNPNQGQPETPLLAALTRRGDVLDAPRVIQLHALWSNELASLPADVVADVVDARLSKPEYSHFLKTGHAQQAAQQGQAAAAVTVRDYPGAWSDAEAQRIHAHRGRIAEQIKANVAASRAGSPGLTGMYS